MNLNWHQSLAELTEKSRLVYAALITRIQKQNNNKKKKKNAAFSFSIFIIYKNNCRFSTYLQMSIHLQIWVQTDIFTHLPIWIQSQKHRVHICRFHDITSVRILKFCCTFTNLVAHGLRHSYTTLHSHLHNSSATVLFYSGCKTLRDALWFWATKTQLIWPDLIWQPAQWSEKSGGPALILSSGGVPMRCETSLHKSFGQLVGRRWVDCNILFFPVILFVLVVDCGLSVRHRPQTSADTSSLIRLEYVCSKTPNQRLLSPLFLLQKIREASQKNVTL